MSHANARLNVFARTLVVHRWQAGWPQAHIAAAMGVSRQCVGKWVGRWQAEGDAGLLDRSSRPHTSPRRTAAEVEGQVLETRQRLQCGPDGIAEATGVPARTASRVLVRHGVPRLADCDPITGEVIRASRKTAVRFERDTPGELVHMDVKKLGRIPDGGGWRVHGRAATEAAKHRNPVGYDYIHSLVDDHSRLAYSEVLTDEKGVTCAAFLTRAAAYFAARGITRIERVMTDNAWAYKHSIKVVCGQLGARQKFIRPHCPWQNGKVERLNRTLATEWAYRLPYASNDERTAALADWLEHYNIGGLHRRLLRQHPGRGLQLLFKAELVRNRGPWEGIDDLEIAVAEYVDWFNHRRLHGEIGLVPPAEHEDDFYRHNPSASTVAASIPSPH